MSEYTPTTDEVETAFHEFASALESKEPGTYPDAPEFTDWREAMAGFRRWLEAHDAEIRADAWDEGALWAAVETGAIRGESDPFLVPDDNPYRTPRPPAPELFPGVQERLDALSIRRAT